MKKTLAIILSICFLFCLTACNKDNTTSETDNSKTDFDEHVEKEIEHSKYWEWTDGVYYNSFVGLSFETFDNWHQYTNEELIALQDADYANLHPNVKELYKDRIVYAAYSNSEDKDSLFSLCYENKYKLEEIKEKEVSLDNYVSEYKTSMLFMFKDAEILNEHDTVFCGNTYRCLEFSIYTSYNGGGYIRQNIYFRQIDDYFVTLKLVAGPFGNESIDDIVSRCCVLQNK